MGAQKELAISISRRVEQLLEGREEMKLLEAGCGSASHFVFSNVTKSVGIDISQAQLDKNLAIQEKIKGDLQTYPLPREEFDIAICWDVLEHLDRPHLALLNLCNSVKSDGVVILGFPNVMSFKGLVTKFTPYWFHKAFYRFMRYTSTPFPTYLRFCIRPAGIVGFARIHGLEIELFDLIEGGMTKRFRKRSRVINFLLEVCDKSLAVVSAGSCKSLFLDNCAFVLRKASAAEKGGRTLPPTFQTAR